MTGSPAPSVYHGVAPADLADSDDTEYENYYDEGGVTSTAASLASQVTDYRYENGRRYHAYHSGSGDYWAPNDDAQQKQEEIFHLVYTMRLDSNLFLAPLEKPEKILDVGTGNGLWCIDMAHTFPDAKITGNDLSPIQPGYVPPNVQFEIDDFNEEWVYPSNHFDFVHGRALYGSVRSWDGLLKQALKVLKPGGWFESVETRVEVISANDSIPHDAPVLYWVRIMREARERAGNSFEVAGHVGQWCKDAGFVEVENKTFILPIGPWKGNKYERTLGSYNLLNMLEAAQGFSLYLLTKFYDMSVPEVEQLLEKVKADLKNKKYKPYFRMDVCYGRKPLEPELKPEGAGEDEPGFQTDSTMVPPAHEDL